MRIDLICLTCLLSMLSAGCGPIPQPFRPLDGSKTHNEYLLAPDAGGITVLRIQGPVAWVGDELAGAIAAALREHGILAGAVTTNQRAMRLTANGYRQDRFGLAELVIEWMLTRPDGTMIRRFETRFAPPSDFWEEPTPALFGEVAQRVAAQAIDRIIGKPAPAHVALVPVEGATDIVDTTLRRHVAAGLRDHGIMLAGLDEAALLILPDISVSPAGASLARVKLRWIVIEPDGMEIGRIDQDNTVPVGRDLTPLAPDIAEAAVPDIVRLVQAYGRTRTADEPTN